ncbi:hypothetical protein A3195_01505 [Candidatus Thiodiazotropha endoloripes]|nr:hypothetical protein A3193_00550 [Candidatus Thiodiazotropha endoloripes]ODB90205.1 hypothetical protein A3195_01505 [Candidatus Thiodiazotropha endoloripes]ODB92083.1 hypothetical protein A3194_06655 [Candidatus Thiodiazotropha endoloripes]
MHLSLHIVLSVTELTAWSSRLIHNALTSSFHPCNAQPMNQIKPTNKMVIMRRLFLWAVGDPSVVRRSG